MVLKHADNCRLTGMQDANAKVCFSCGQTFSTFRRKHHCRTCGQIFCSSCTGLVTGRHFGQSGTVRLCKPCEEIIFGSDDDDDSTILSDDGEDQSRSPAQGSNRASTDLVTNLPGPAFSGVNTEVATPSIGIPVSRRNREAKRRSAIIEFDSQPALARPTSSHSLISLSRRPRSSSHRRRHSRLLPSRGLRSSIDDHVPFQQGDEERKSSLPAFHDDNIIDPDLAAFLSDDGSDDDDSPSIMAAVSAAGAASPGERERLGFSGLFASALKKSRPRTGDKDPNGSSIKGFRDDDIPTFSYPTRHASKLSRSRHRSRSNLLTTNEIEAIQSTRSHSPHRTVEQSAAKVVSSSALHGPNYPTTHLNSASIEHIKNLLAQILRSSSISHARAWEKALLPILLRCTTDVDPDVQQGDDMDIRHYIKLKKVPGGKPSDTSYVSGVVFSKNVALKTMSRSVIQPRIAIVTFAIEYARHETHFMSLDPVIAQEEEYLRNLVSRIAALRPHVLLVQKHVSGLALKLLEDAKITVAYNIKESVLAAVARVTQTTMIKSIDKLGIDPSHLGRCDSFDVKTYLADGSRKTYIFLSGCDPDLGCTIVLRGADTKTLRKIKRVTEFMCYVAYNLKLEDWLMRDGNIAIPEAAVPGQLACNEAPQVQAQDATTFHDTEGSNAETGEPTVGVAKQGQHYKYEQIERETRSKLLSASPFVTFKQPHLLIQLRELEKKLATYRMLHDRYAAADQEGDDTAVDQNQNFALVQPEMVQADAPKNLPKAIREYLHAVHEAQLEKAEFLFQTQERHWDTFINGEVDPYDPFWHQRIVVLYSLVSSITSAPCSGPELLVMVYYAGYGRAPEDQDEDMPLGQYIEDLSVAANSTCKDCNKKMSDHHRQYVHGFGQLSVSIQRQTTKSQNYNNNIWMWSTCRICRHETTATLMSDQTWKYSFAKYLELSFWSNPLGPSNGSCPHDIHKDYLRCFSFQGKIVGFSYEPIAIYEVVAPRASVTWKVEADIVMKNEQYSQLEQRLESFTNSIKNRLDSINVDTLDEKKAAEANDLLQELRERADTDHEELLRKLQQRYSESRYYELVPMNRALRLMDERAIAWDEEFNNFERDYFPSETDIRKLATIQLRNMFLESQPQPPGGTGESDTEDGTEMTSIGRKTRGRPSSVSDSIPEEKVQDVMSSVVEEHKASNDENTGSESKEKCANNELDADALRDVPPVKDQEEAVERNDVKHLDLAVPSRQPDESSPEVLNPSEDSSSPAPPGFADDSTAGDSFVTPPKPLSSGLLERIEQIRSSQTSGDQERPESKIPRLIDLKKQDGNAKYPPVPPLLRAKSQPSHVPRYSGDFNNDPVSAAPNHSSEDAPQPERRLQDRLGISRLALKVGKVAPSLIPRSIPFRSDEHASHVSALARHFEQMSREFEKERLKERRQRALRSRQARANPLASSQPVVEVYQNATDAVGEQGHSQDSVALNHDFTEDLTTHKIMEEVVTEVQPEPVRTINPGDAIKRDSEGDTEPANKQGETDLDERAVESDTEIITRRRKSSDPVSGRSSSTIRSPTYGPDNTDSLTDAGSELSIPEHKKNAWFKYLTEFWSKRTASGWANLEYPLHGNEHVFEDSDIIVREDEPSSVIALALACPDYRNKVKEFRSQPKRPAPPRNAGRSTTMINSELEGDSGKAEIEASLLSESGTHMKYSFSHGTFRTSCKIFYAESFDALRRRCGVADRFIESMSRCLKFDSKGGKSKSLFLRTLDGRFMIKSLQEVELKAFTKFAPDYFAFMSYALFHGVPSVIAKMFGLFQVNIRNPATGIEFSYYLLIMENLFYERNPNRRFDLKGSMRNRKIESTGEADEVLLDENLVETIFESPLFVREHSRKLLQASVYNDTLWLCKQNVMDYSLMAGFDDNSKELVVGIIDCIRTYTWDKKLESWIKDRGKNKPTITSPKDYRNRFRVSMMQYVLQAPDCWHQFQANMAPPKTLKEREEKFQQDEAEDIEAEKP